MPYSEAKALNPIAHQNQVFPNIFILAFFEHLLLLTKADGALDLGPREAGANIEPTP